MKPRYLPYLIVLLGFAAGTQPAVAQESAAEETAAEETAAAETPADDGHAHAHGPVMVKDAPYTPLGELLAEALDTHPSVLRRRAQVEVERQKTRGVGIRPDPMVSLSAESLPWNSPNLTSSSMSGIKIGITQPLWWPGELSAMKEASEARAEALVPLADEQQVDLVIRAVELYYDIYEIDRSIEALAELKEPVNEFLRLLRARLSTGKSSVAQIERIRLQLLSIDDRLFFLHHQRPEKVAELNAALNRPAGSPVNPPPEDADAAQALGSLDELVEAGMKRRPIVEAIKRQKDAALAEGRTARYARYPDLSVFGGWMFRAEQGDGMAGDGTDTFSIGISSTLPLWSGARADAAEDVARARVVDADTALAAFRLDLRGQIDAKLARLQHFKRHARYYRDTVIPQAEQARKAALAGFQAGRASYEDWVQGEEEILKLKINLVEFEAGIRKQRALTLALTGQLDTAGHAQNAQENHDDQ